MAQDNQTPHSSEEYDLKVGATIPYYDLFHNETISIVKTVNPHPRTWLDTGCGTGTLVKKALKEFPTTQFILSDPSGKMLKEAGKKLDGASNVRFLKPSPTQDLKGLSGLDVVSSIQSHHYLDKPGRKKAVAKCFQLLADGGIYVTFENVRPETEEGTRLGLQRWSAWQLSAGRGRRDVEAHIRRFDTEYFPITIGEHLALLKSAGFSVAEPLWHSHMQAGLYCVK